MTNEEKVYTMKINNISNMIINYPDEQKWADAELAKERDENASLR